MTEMGVTDLMPPSHPHSSVDGAASAPPAPSPAEALRRLLLAYLTTFSALVRALGRPPLPLPTSQEEADAWRPGVAEVGRLAEVGVNMLVRVNELRGEQVSPDSKGRDDDVSRANRLLTLPDSTACLSTQAKATLEGLLEAQIARRRAETRVLARCVSLRRPCLTRHVSSSSGMAARSVPGITVVAPAGACPFSWATFC